MRIRKQKRPTEGIRDVYVQRPPAQPTPSAAPQTKSRLRPKPDFLFGSYPKGGRRWPKHPSYQGGSPAFTS